MIYYISEVREKNKNNKTAGSKARIDVDFILKNNCEKFIDTSNVYTQSSKIKKIISAIKIDISLLFKKFKINENDIIFFQYPLYHLQKKILRYTKKCKVIPVIHDLQWLREDYSEEFKEKELEFLMSCYKIISHNTQMTNYLIKNGIKESKILNLQIFDYLLPEPNKVNCNTKINDICYAGNLEKSQFIYKLNLDNTNISIGLYGVGYKKNIKNKNIYYYGSFLADDIPYYLNGKYGLIWDGDSIDTCNNTYGIYLKYNTPHKISLYIASSIPIIIWKDSALADYVIKNNIGLIVDSLENIPDILNKISDNEYNIMKNNVEKIRKDVVSGMMLQRTIDLILKNN